MKNNILENFPVLSSKEKNIINEKYLNVEVEPITTILGNNVSIEYQIDETNKNIIYLLPGKFNWDCTTNDLKINVNVRLDNPNIFYEDFDLADKNSVIGLGVMLSCKQSRFCKYIKMKPIYYGEKYYEDDKIIVANEEQIYNLRSDLKLSFFVYLEKVNNDKDFYHARVKGTKFGDIKEIQLIFEGDSPEISIAEVDVKDKPFIYYSIDWNDLNDNFNSTCKIYINKASKNYKKIKIDDFENESIKYLYVEFYTNFFYEILYKSLEDYNEEEEYEIGSVGRVVYTYRKTLNLNTEIIENRMELYERLKQYIEKQINK